MSVKSAQKSKRLSSSSNINIDAAVRANKRLGYSSEKWRTIQRAVGTSVDGIPGRQTARMVGDYQLRNGLQVDGVAGPQTWGKISGSSHQSASKGSGGGNSQINVSLAVSQNRGLGYSQRKWRHIQSVVGTSVDGSPGPRTAQAVAAFQSRCGLKVDGVAGPQTCKRIALVKAFPKDEGHSSGPAPSSGGWVWPAQSRKVSSPFGMRLHPIHKVWRMHNGVDISRQGGLKIFAAKAGTVSTGWSKGGGNILYINHGGGYSTAYMHLAGYKVRSGRVSAGQHVATMGTTGGSTGVHLHFEIRVNGKARNPMKYY